MKKFDKDTIIGMAKAIFLVLILSFMLVYVIVNADAKDVWTENQVWAHQTAESARKMGLSEDNPIIVECKRIWAEEEAKKDTPLPEGIPCDEVDKHNMRYIGDFKITGYDACVACCGNTRGITASGAKATVNHTVAMCSDYPFGTVIYIEGLGYYTVEDRGVGKGVVDVFCNNHTECYAITGTYPVYIVEETE